MRMLIEFVPYLPRKKTVGTGGAYGDFITMSLITPITVKLECLVRHPPCHRIVSPTGFLKPNNFAAASLITKPAESLAMSLEKSRPSMNCQPSVLPYPGVTVTFPHSGINAGSFPLQSKPPFVYWISVGAPDDSAISNTTPVLFNSVRST